ncbi:HNH endonuclease [Pelomyxa schiedti]|nr:HNH endonuclease [Pelomyxa schiedti]
MYGAERLAVHGSLEPNGPHPVILISLKNQELAEEESVEEESAEESAEEESMSPSGAAPSVLTLGTFHDLIGKRFHTFEEMCEARLHRSWRSGICPCGKKVAESVVVCNSTWADDDRGDVLWFTGQGKGKDQELKQGNLSLANACEANKPIRVIRGHQLKTDIAPSWGYRYDGLYKIIKYQTESHEGRRIWRFLMERLEGQPEAPYKSREESPPPPPPGYRKRLQLSSSSSSPSLSSDSERYDDPTSPPLPPPTPTQAFTVPRIYSPSPALVSGKTPMDQFLAVHSGFTSMTNAEILEWIANGLCAFCGASVKPTTYRKV